jgi:hypothetical protein
MPTLITSKTIHDCKSSSAVRQAVRVTSLLNG